MRELTVRIKFTAHCLGNQKKAEGKSPARFVFQRNPQTGQVVFLPGWHRSNLKMAAELLGRHQQEVQKIFWDQNVDGVPKPELYECHQAGKGRRRGKARMSRHEAFYPGQVVGINLVLPSDISEDDFIRLMEKAGQYRGLSPWRPGEFGFFTVVSLRQRNIPEPADDGGVEELSKLEGTIEQPVE